MRRKSAKTASESIEDPQTNEQALKAQRIEDEPLGDVHFAEYIGGRLMSDDSYQSKSYRVFFSDDPEPFDDLDSEEEDDFDDDFDDDFEPLPDDEFNEFIEGDGDEEDDIDDGCEKEDDDLVDDEFDSMNADEDVFETDDYEPRGGKKR